MDIVMTGFAGCTGSAMLAKHFSERLQERLPVQLVERVQQFRAEEAPLAGKYMEPIGEGGVFAALWRLAETAGVGITVELNKIPIQQETIEVCEILDITPYQLQSGGFLYLADYNRHMPGTVIGEINHTKDRMVVGYEGARYLTKPQMDEMKRIL